MHCSVVIKLTDSVTVGDKKEEVEIEFPYVLQTALPDSHIRNCLFYGIGQTLGQILDAAMAELDTAKKAVVSEHEKAENEKSETAKKKKLPKSLPPAEEKVEKPAADPDGVTAVTVEPPEAQE